MITNYPTSTFTPPPGVPSPFNYAANQAQQNQPPMPNAVAPQGATPQDVYSNHPRPPPAQQNNFMQSQNDPNLGNQGSVNGLGIQLASSGMMPQNTPLAQAVSSTPGLNPYLNRGLGGAPSTTVGGNGMPGAIQTPSAVPQMNRIAGVRMR